MAVKLSKGIELPLELASRRSAFFGISGSGKSNSATVCIEGLLDAGEQVVLVDPKGEGWGLQSSADGKKAGYNVIVFGKPRGDIPDLREEHGEQIADFVVDSGRSVVLSLLGFDSDQSERRFVTQFFKRLYRRKSQLTRKTRTLVVLEEAHLFVPQDVTGSQAEMVGAIQRIARQGRSAGLGLMIVDQRPQDVSKKIISQTELLVCHQLVHKLDRAALQDWVKAYDREDQAGAFLDSLAELQQGEGWIWSPAWLHLFQRAKMPMRKTYDSGATPDGSSAEAPKAKATIDLEALKTHLAKVVEQAKADDPKELKKQIQVLKGELAKAQQAAPAKVIVHKPADLDTLERDLQPLIESVSKAFGDLTQTVLQRINRALQRTSSEELTIPKTIKHLTGTYVPPHQNGVRGRREPVPPVTRQNRTGDDGEPVKRYASPKVEQSVLDALAEFEQIGIPEPTRAQLGLMSGVNPSSGHFDNVMSDMASAGLVKRERGTTSLTDLGRSRANLPETPRDLKTYLAKIKKMVERCKESGTLKLFEAIVDNFDGNQFTRDELGQLSGLNPGSGHYDNCLGPLVTLGLIQRKGGKVRPTSLMFPTQLTGSA